MVCVLCTGIDAVEVEQGGIEALFLCRLQHASTGARVRRMRERASNTFFICC